MGLAGVELILALEDRFYIDITDQDAMQVVTVRDLQRLIARKLHPPQSDLCLTGHTFYQVRKTLMAQFQLPRNAIVLDCPVAEVIPRRQRKVRWQQFGNALALTLPPLEVPHWLRYLRGLVFAAASLAAFLPLLRAFGDPVWLGALGSMVLAGMVGALALAVVAWMTEPFEGGIPRTCRTMRDLVTQLVRINYREDQRRVAPPEIETWTDSQIWQIITETIASECKVPRETITPEGSLWRDICQD